MLGRWIRLLEAERALGAARFEEALELAGHPGVRDHRRAVEVRAKAAAALLARARERLSAGDLSSAACDLRLAAGAAPGSAEARALGKEIAPRLEEREARARLVTEAVAAADRAEKAGDLLEARERIRGIDGPAPGVRKRLVAIEERLAEQERAVEEATRACEKGEVEAAEQALARLRKLAPRHPLLPSLAVAVETARRLPALRGEAERARAGEASRAFAFLARHAALRPDLFSTPEARTILQAVRDARRLRVHGHLDAGVFRSAASEARRLAATGEDAESRPLVEGALLAARGAEALARGDEAVAGDALARAVRGLPEVASIAAMRDRLHQEGPAAEPIPLSLARVREAEVEALRRPWDFGVLEAAIRLAEGEEKRSPGGAGVAAVTGRLGALRPTARAHRAFREALARGKFAAAARELCAAVEGLRRTEELEAAEDLRLEGSAALLAAMEEEVRGGKVEALGEAVHSPGMEDLVAGLFEERLAGLRDAAPGRPGKAAGALGLLAAGGAAREGFPKRFFLRLEEGGDALVLARDTIRIGHAKEPSNDLPLLARVASRHAEIHRRVSFHDGIVYEIVPSAGHSVSLNGEPLYGPSPLRDGDRISLGGSVSFEFRLPSAKSRSALLSLARGFEVEGASCVVLLKPGADGRILVGDSSEAHLAGCGKGGEGAEVVLEADGSLLCRSPGVLLVDGSPVSGEARLRGGESVAAGKVRFLVARD